MCLVISSGGYLGAAERLSIFKVTNLKINFVKKSCLFSTGFLFYLWCLFEFQERQEYRIVLCILTMLSSEQSEWRVFSIFRLRAYLCTRDVKLYLRRVLSLILERYISNLNLSKHFVLHTIPTAIVLSCMVLMPDKTDLWVFFLLVVVVVVCMFFASNPKELFFPL